MEGSNMEKEKIRKTLQYFFEGVDAINEGIVEKAFHPSAAFYCKAEEGIRQTPVTTYYSFFPGIRSNPDHPWNRKKAEKVIESIDISGDIASVKAQWTFEGFKNMEYYNLVSDGENWYIVNKVWHTVQL